MELGFGVRPLSRCTSFISQSSKQHMLWQCNHLIQAGETCSPDEQPAYRLLCSSAYECIVCWSGKTSLPVFHPISSKAQPQPDGEAASSSFPLLLHHARCSRCGLRALPPRLLAADAVCAEVRYLPGEISPQRSAPGRWRSEQERVCLGRQVIPERVQPKLTKVCSERYDLIFSP